MQLTWDDEFFTRALALCNTKIPCPACKSPTLRPDGRAGGKLRLKCKTCTKSCYAGNPELTSVYFSILDELHERDAEFFQKYNNEAPPVSVLPKARKPSSILKESLESLPTPDYPESSSTSQDESSSSEDEIPSAQDYTNNPFQKNTPLPTQEANTEKKSKIALVLESIASICLKALNNPDNINEETILSELLDSIDSLRPNLKTQPTKQSYAEAAARKKPTQRQQTNQRKPPTSRSPNHTDTSDTEKEDDWNSVSYKKKRNYTQTMPAKRELTREQQDRIMAGLPPHEVGFATIELHNIHRLPLSEIRKIFVRLGVENRWIRDMVTIAPRTMELIVFKERVDDIKRLLASTNFRIETETIQNRLENATNEEIIKTKRRLAYQINRLHSRMVMVRRYLHEQYANILSEMEVRQCKDMSDNEF
jgi:hypothetical protein